MWDGGETFVAGVYSSLQAHVDKGRLAYAMKRVQELVRKLDRAYWRHRRRAALRSLTESLGRATADESFCRRPGWRLQAELSRLARIAPVAARKSPV